MNIHYIRTLHYHWGQHSGYNQLLAHLDPTRASYTEHLVYKELPDWRNLPLKAFRKLGRKLLHCGHNAYDLGDWWAERRAFRDGQAGGCDLIHYMDSEHSYHFLPTWQSRVDRADRTPVCLSFHQPPEVLDKYIFPERLEQADAIVAISPSQQRLLQNRLPSQPIDLVLLGVDTDYFVPAPREKQKTIEVLTVGNYWRDFPSLQKMARYAEKSNLPIRFTIVAHTVDPSAFGSNTQVLQGISDVRLREIYQHADIMLVPLFKATANCAILEAMACGVPVITSDLEDLRAYIGPDAGAYLEGNDPEQGLELLQELVQNPDQLARMSRAARVRAEALSWDQQARAFHEIYERLLPPK